LEQLAGAFLVADLLVGRGEIELGRHLLPAIGIATRPRSPEVLGRQVEADRGKVDRGRLDVRGPAQRLERRDVDVEVAEVRGDLAGRAPRTGGREGVVVAEVQRRQVDAAVERPAELRFARAVRL